MPVQLSYPGVYVEEVPSGVRSDHRAARRPSPRSSGVLSGAETSEPVTVTSFGDFERGLRRAVEGERARVRGP